MKIYQKRKCYRGLTDLFDIFKSAVTTYPNDRLSNSQIQEDKFFSDFPFPQALLTEEGKTLQQNIDFSNFNQKSFLQINTNNKDDCFKGILNFIYTNSGNKFNTNEIQFHFSGGKNRKSSSSPCDQKYNILNIFDYNNNDNQFNVECTKNAFFGVTFNRIKVKPTFYSIRSGALWEISRFLSFTFEGYNEKQQKWDILDERTNLFDFTNGGDFKPFAVRSTDNNYSSFKLLQNEPGRDGYWGFSFGGFEIHGDISLN